MLTLYYLLVGFCGLRTVQYYTNTWSFWCSVRLGCTTSDAAAQLHK